MCPLYEYECVKCKERFEQFVPYHYRNAVKHCGVFASKLISLPNTDADRSYQFEAHVFGDKPVQVRSKTHYRELCKKNNMPDCSPLEGMQEARMKKKSRDDDYKRNISKRADRAFKRMKNDNVSHVAKEAMQKIIKAKKGGSDG